MNKKNQLDSLSSYRGSKPFDLPADSSSSAVLGLDSSFQSVIGKSRDVDWVRMTLSGGQTYEVRLRGVDTSGGTLSDPLISGVHDSSGKSLGVEDDDGGEGLDAFILFTPRVSGDYFVAVAGYGKSRGSYTLELLSDNQAPEILSWEPELTADVSTSADLKVIFSENIFRGSGSITIFPEGGSPIVIGITDETQVSIAGEQLLIDPITDLLPSTRYTVTIESGAILDASGNSYAFSSADELEFTTSELRDPLEPGEQRPWNIMVYLAADNDLESFAIADVNEMESAVSDDLYVTALFDRSGGYDTSNGNWTDSRVSQIQSDLGSGIISFSGSKSWGEKNSGSPQTLKDFILWSSENFPAENYALIIWNHGGGIDGVAWDDTDGSHLTLKQTSDAVTQAISESDSDTLIKFEVIAFDACLMGMFEIAYQFRNQANYFVASEELIPGTGFAYDNLIGEFLQGVDRLTTQGLISPMLESYREEYAGSSDITLAAVDLSKINSLALKLEDFAATAGNLTSREFRNLQRLASSVIDFPSTGGYDFIDLGHFMELISSSSRVQNELKLKAQEVIVEINASVFDHVGSVTDASGLSVHLPVNGVINSNYQASEISFLEDSAAWHEFVSLMSSGGSRLRGGSETRDGREYSFTEKTKSDNPDRSDRAFLKTGKKSEMTNSPDSNFLFGEFKEFLGNNPDWIENQGFGGLQVQVITGSKHFSNLELPNPGLARAFDYWYETIFPSPFNDESEQAAEENLSGNSTQRLTQLQSFLYDQWGPQLVVCQPAISIDYKFQASNRPTECQSLMVQGEFDRLASWNLGILLDAGGGNDQIKTSEGNDFIFGGSGKDRIASGSGNDYLIGGLDRDRLMGGMGSDWFVFNDLAPKGADNVLDFRSTENDKIVLDLSVFDGLRNNLLFDSGEHCLFSDEFFSGNLGEAQESHKIIFDTRSGNLWYDEDGWGVDRPAVHVATLGGISDMKLNDILLLYPEIGL